MNNKPTSFKVYSKSRAGPKARIEYKNQTYYQDELAWCWELGDHEVDNVSEYPLYWERLNS